MLKTRKKKSLLYHPVSVFFLLCLLLLMINSVYSAFLKRRQALHDLGVVQEEYQKTKEIYGIRQKENEAIQTNRGQEKILREKYNATLPGEQVIRIIE